MIFKPLFRLFSGNYILVPKVATRECLLSMALRNDHSFEMPTPPDEEILKMRKENLFCHYLTTHEKENRLISMGQLYEEATGQGFFQHK